MGRLTDVWSEHWPTLYERAKAPVSYPGGSESYELAGKFLAGDALVEEWGCATTYGRKFIPAPYRGIDGGPSIFVDQVVDLREYISNVPRALIRHVLEHNWEWHTILDNFLASFTDRAVIILFIPLGLHDLNRSFEHLVSEPPTPPGLQMDEARFLSRLSRPGLEVVGDEELFNDTPPFGYERIFYLEKKADAKPLSVVQPRCTVGDCDTVTYDRVRVDYTVLGNRFEYAFNCCHRHAQGLMTGLYNLEIPTINWSTT